MKTRTVIAPSSRRRLWVTAAVVVSVTVGIVLLLFGPFLKARAELALHGISWTEYPTVLHDACARDDDPVPLSAILGKVIAVPGRGRNLHLRFPFRVLIASWPDSRKMLARIGLLPLGRRVARFLL